MCIRTTAFLSFLAILCNFAIKWVHLSFSPLLFASLLFTAICKASPDWKRSAFILIPKKGNAKECSNYSIIALIGEGNGTPHEVAKVLEFQLQHHSFQRNPKADFLQNGLVGSPCSPRDSQESSPTPWQVAKVAVDI